jgi:hypothetical protein
MKHILFSAPTAVTKFGVKKEGAQEPCKEKLKKKHST